MKPSLPSIKEPVKEEMRTFPPYFKSTINTTQVSFLSYILNYILRNNGKQIRPLLVFLSARMFEKPSNRTYIAASLIELLHTASLIHDDVVDDSYLRRNLFSVNALWKSKISVLTGDYLLAKGLNLAIENQEYELLHIISEAVQEMSEGEILQTKKMRKTILDPEDYYSIMLKKTARLISASVVIGAKSVNATGSQIASLKQFGEFAGIVFQIKDDLIDYQTSAITGKPKGMDIKENKLNLPLIYALQNADPRQERHILSLLHHPHNNSNVVKLIDEFVRNKNGIEDAKNKMDQYKHSAIDILNYLPKNRANQSLRQLVEYFAERRK